MILPRDADGLIVFIFNLGDGRQQRVRLSTESALRLARDIMHTLTGVDPETIRGAQLVFAAPPSPDPPKGSAN